MDRADLVRRFACLFEGRKDAYGLDEGGCAYVDPTAFDPERLWTLHLTGEHAIGVYPLVEDNELPDGTGITHSYGWVVKWGCSDLDLKTPRKPSGDYDTPEAAHVAALNLQSALAALGITGWIERTRSGGFHVWCFVHEWVPARTMRRALLVAHQIAGVRSTEVNPKSESLPEGAVGNYVRLPYPRSLNAKGIPLPLQNRVMLNVEQDGRPFYIDGWLYRAERSLASAETLQNAADLWVQAKPEHAIELGEIPELTREITDKLSAKTYFVLGGGPLGDAIDRSAWLFRLAAMCADDGVTPEEAVAVIAEADHRHTKKYVNRRDGERWLRRTVERAYAGR